MMAMQRNFENINGHQVFEIMPNDADYRACGLETLFENEEKYWWFIARKEFIQKQMAKHVPKEAKIMEVGAGTGNITRFLLKNGYQNVSVGEMHLHALDYAKDYGIENRYCFNLLNSPFENEFDCICAFDVLEHIEDDLEALKNIHQALKENGKLVLTVPAFQRLWNQHDVDVGHKRRYTKLSLRQVLNAAGFEISTAYYFFVSITPLLLLRAFLKPAQPDQIPKGDTVEKIHPIFNSLLLALSRLDNLLIPHLPNPFGGSLFAIAKKV